MEPLNALEQLQKLIATTGVSPTAAFSVFMRACKTTLRQLLTPTTENQLENVFLFLLELQPTFNKETLILLHCTELLLSLVLPRACVVVVPALWKGQYIEQLPYDLQLPKSREEYKNEHALNKALSKSYMKHHIETEISKLTIPEQQEKKQRYQGFLQHYKKSSKKDDMCDAWTQVHSWHERLVTSGMWAQIISLYPLTPYATKSPDMEVVSIDFGTSNLGWWRGTVDTRGQTDTREWKVVDLTETSMSSSSVSPPADSSSPSSSLDRKRKRKESKVQKPKKKRKTARKPLSFEIQGLDLIRKRLNPV